jgi:predicted nucleic acid-binding protein
MRSTLREGLALQDSEVYQELCDPKSTVLIRHWLQQVPQWFRIQTVDRSAAITLAALDPGEQDSILFIEQQGATLIIIDDLPGRLRARATELASNPASRSVLLVGDNTFVEVFKG